MRPRISPADAALVIFVGLAWGLLAPATKALFLADHTVFDGLSVVIARGAWAFPLFLIMLGASWMLERPRLTARRWGAIGIAGLAFGFGISVLFSIAAQYTSISHISFLLGSSPITNSLAAALVFRLRIERRERLALALGFVGITLLALAHNGNHASLFGDALMLVWLAAFALYAVMIRSIGGAVSSTFVMAAVGSVAMGSIVLLSLFVPGSGRAVAHVVDTPLTAWWFLGEIILAATILGQTAFARAVPRLGVAVATIGAEYTALAVGIAASVITHEPWTIVTVIAGVILCGALAVTFVPLPERFTRATRPGSA